MYGRCATPGSQSSSTSITLCQRVIIHLQLADAMELMILSVLSPAVECQWGLTKTEGATITSVSMDIMENPV